MNNAIFTSISAIRSYERSIKELQQDAGAESLELGKLLKAQRKSSRLTLEEASKLAGRSVDVVSRWEKGCIACLQEVADYSLRVNAESIHPESKP